MLTPQDYNDLISEEDSQNIIPVVALLNGSKFVASDDIVNLNCNHNNDDEKSMSNVSSALELKILNSKGKNEQQHKQHKCNIVNVTPDVTVETDAQLGGSSTDAPLGTAVMRPPSFVDTVSIDVIGSLKSVLSRGREYLSRVFDQTTKWPDVACFTSSDMMELPDDCVQRSYSKDLKLFVSSVHSISVSFKDEEDWGVIHCYSLVLDKVSNDLFWKSVNLNHLASKKKKQIIDLFIKHKTLLNHKPGIGFTEEHGIDAILGFIPKR